MENKKITPITRINKSYKLYGLYCPYSDELRYIGITTGLLSTRLSGHLRNPTNGKIALWFKELKSNDKKPLSNKYNLNIDDIKNYIKEGLNLVQIGNKYGCSNKIIHKYIKKHGK